MKDVKKMTNAEFMNDIMDGYSNYGALVQSVVLDCLQRGLDHYISHKDEILEEYNRPREDGRIPLINMKAWVECCEETQNRINEKYS